MPVDRPKKRQQDALVGIGAGLQRIRLAAGLTQVDLAKLLKTTQATVSRWEREIDMPSYKDVNRVEDALKARRGSLLVASGLVDVPDVEAALLADRRLDPLFLEVVLAAYHAAVARSDGGRKPRK